MFDDPAGDADPYADPAGSEAAELSFGQVIGAGVGGVGSPAGSDDLSPDSWASDGCGSDGWGSDGWGSVGSDSGGVGSVDVGRPGAGSAGVDVAVVGVGADGVGAEGAGSGDPTRRPAGPAAADRAAVLADLRRRLAEASGQPAPLGAPIPSAAPVPARGVATVPLRVGTAASPVSPSSARGTRRTVERPDSEVAALDLFTQQPGQPGEPDPTVRAAPTSTGTPSLLPPLSPPSPPRPVRATALSLPAALPTTLPAALHTALPATLSDGPGLFDHPARPVPRSTRPSAVVTPVPGGATARLVARTDRTDSGGADPDRPEARRLREVGGAGRGPEQPGSPFGNQGSDRSDDQGSDQSGDPSRRTVVPVPGPLAAVLPRGGLPRGGVVSLAGQGATSLLFSLLAGSRGQWAALVGMPGIGLAAAAEFGIDLDRLAVIPDPGEDVLQILSVLFDGVEVVAVAAPKAPPASGRLRVLTGRLRQRGAVLLVTGPWPGADITLTATLQGWTGLHQGHGRLRDRELLVQARGRGAAARSREAVVLLRSDRRSVQVVPAVARPAVAVGEVSAELAESVVG